MSAGLQEIEFEGGRLRLRPETVADEDFRFALFCASRSPVEDFSPLGPELAQRLQHQQFLRRITAIAQSFRRRASTSSNSSKRASAMSSSTSPKPKYAWSIWRSFRSAGALELARRSSIAASRRLKNVICRCARACSTAMRAPCAFAGDWASRRSARRRPCSRNSNGGALEVNAANAVA